MDPYPYPWPGGTAYNLPDSRRACWSVVDLGTNVYPRSIDADAPFPYLRDNAQGDKHWAMYDSFARRFGTVRQFEGPDGYGAYVYDNAGTQLDFSALGARQFSLAGRGAMLDERMESQFALVAIAMQPGSPYGTQAFLRRAALPDSIRAVVDDHDAGTGVPGGRSTSYYTGPAGDPAYRSVERHFNQRGQGLTRRTYTVRPFYDDTRYLMVNTTGVAGGGKVRGIIRATTVVDFRAPFRYADPNECVGSFPEGTCQMDSHDDRWWYVNVQFDGSDRIWGWLPIRDGEPVSAA